MDHNRTGAPDTTEIIQWLRKLFLDMAHVPAFDFAFKLSKIR